MKILSTLKKSIKYFYKVIHSIITYHAEREERTVSITLKELHNQLERQFGWIDFTPETINLINSFEDLEEKVIERLKQKIELKALLPIMDALTLYEFSKLKPNIENGNGEKLHDRKLDYLKEISSQVHSIEKIEPLKDDTYKQKRTKLKKFFQNLSNLFSSLNVIVMFISWLILLSIIFVLPTLLLFKAFNTNMDATALISIASVPFLGAITLVATIYTKNKK